MVTKVLQLRRVLNGMGASDEQADEFVEAMGDYATRGYLDMQLAKLYNRILLGELGIAGLIIGAVALIVHL